MDGKNMLLCVLSIATLVIAILILIKVNKKSGEKYGQRKVKDIGPSAAGDRVNLASSNPFVQQCQQLYNNNPCDGPCSYNVCGNDTGAAMQDNTNMDDTTCQGSSYVAYQASDCSNPMTWQAGYLCGGPCGAPGQGSVVTGNAPANPWGCPSICQ